MHSNPELGNAPANVATLNTPLKGADIVLLPSNWWGSGMETVWQTRARENGVWFLAANRWGTEVDTRFGFPYTYDMNDAPSAVIKPNGLTSPLLQVEHLHVHQGRQRVLHEVGLEVRPGELWCILGPNGAGKSTLLRACMGMARPSAGTVRIGGRDLAAIPRAELARVLAWVPQYVDTSMGFTGLELVLMGRSPYLGLWGLPSSGDLQKARDVMRELGIEHLASRSVMATSGGERRLLLLARALVQAPRLMLLDEPTAFLDLKHQVELLAHLRERVRGGMAAVVVLHDVNLALACADRVLLLKQGAVLAQGPAGEILREELLRALFDVDMDRGVTNAGQVVFVPRALR